MNPVKKPDDSNGITVWQTEHITVRTIAYMMMCGYRKIPGAYQRPYSNQGPELYMAAYIDAEI
jgi:hypothetical protein